MSAQMRPQALAVQARPMTQADLPEIMAIEQQAYEFAWTEAVFSDCLQVGYCCWVFVEGAALRGYAIVAVALDEAHLLNLCVHPLWQNRGIGRTILLHVLELARTHGACRVFLEVRPSNDAAVHLYYDLDFYLIGRRRAYYPAADGREDALVLSRSL